MSHWARLENNIVTEVVVGKNNSRDEGEHFVKKLGGTWLKTSYNRNTRNKYAAIGDFYDEARDIFVTPKPYPSWVEDEENLGFWKPPAPYPVTVDDPELVTKEGVYYWDEGSVSWVKMEVPNE